MEPNKIKVKKKEFEGLRWVDNCSDMKHFCGDKCTITYETCAIDDYWLLSVFDAITKDWVQVPSNDWVIKIDEGRFIVVDACVFNKFFEIKKEDE